MYDYNEIKLNNQQDSWSLLYLHLSRSIMKINGRQGEAIIRKAIRQVGNFLGEAYKNKLETAGINTHLQHVDTNCCELTTNPRTRKHIVEQTEEVYLWEVYTCPMEHIWRLEGGLNVGRFYCEEMTHSFMDAYTDGFGQCNLSKLLTNPLDNHCRFSMYYREANVDEKKLKTSFSPEGKTTEKQAYHEGFYAETIELHTLLIYYFLLQEAKKQGGSEGEMAVSLGLREFAAAICHRTMTEASHQKVALNETFISENTSIPLSIDKWMETYPIFTTELKTHWESNLVQLLQAYINEIENEVSSCTI